MDKTSDQTKNDVCGNIDGFDTNSHSHSHAHSDSYLTELSKERNLKNSKIDFARVKK